MFPHRVHLFFSIATSSEVILRGIKIAGVVGLLLNLINQGEHLIALQFSKIHWLKFGVTFTVPFCVSVYSAAQIKMSLTPGNRAYEPLQLKCARCNEHRVVVPKNRLIPECPHCKRATRWTLTGNQKQL